MPALLTSTPAADGFWMPGEFGPHDGCYMIWPERPDNWREDARPAQEAFAAVAEAIAVSDPVTMLASAAQYTRARAALSPAVRVVETSSDDAWCRDSGPTFVVDGQGRRRAIDWEFNAWGGHDGGLYDPWDADDLVAAKIAELERADRYRAPFVLEGGSIHVDGEGTVYTTRECLLNRNRNPALNEAQVEAALRAYLGVEQVVWFDEGTFGDETDGHVDNLVHVVAPGVVALNWAADPDDPQHASSVAALDVLRAARDARGREIEVHLLPAPGPLYATEAEVAGVRPAPGTLPRVAGENLSGSYANFYIGASRVVVPLLDERTDDEALALIASMLPDREVVGVPGREILLGGGNVHCITQQVPSA